ncbi:MAG: hypothetical protein WA765_19390 [Candidatus Acidiferrum sp.]
MRVEVVEKIANRIEARGISPIDAPPTLAIKNFLAAIESDDSLFCIAQPFAGPSATESAGGRFYSGDIVLKFRQAEHRQQRSLHFVLVEKLSELLKDAGSPESLGTTLCLTSASISAGNPEGKGKPIQNEMALWLRLDAIGDSAEQAVLRWGLGLTHIQQALLFTSRHLRLHLAKNDG